MSDAKVQVAKKAFEEMAPQINKESILGIGTGSTVNCFIEILKQSNVQFKGAVSSSEASTLLLQEFNVEIFSLNDVNEIQFYIDGADEVDPSHNLIKGGGGAHTREKLVASASNQFICIVDQSKHVECLGDFGVPIEVLIESRSFVSREIVKLGGVPTYRSGVITDQNNHIIDVSKLDLSNPKDMEIQINSIPGVVENGIFAIRKPNKVLTA